MADDSRESITTRAGKRCEYCQMHQSLQGATFHIEHVVPRVMGGLSDSSNLALACPSCNLHKADRISVTSSVNGDVIPLFNPRHDDWNNRFEWDDYTLIAKTEIGRVTKHSFCARGYRGIPLSGRPSAPEFSNAFFRIYPGAGGGGNRPVRENQTRHQSWKIQTLW